MMAARRSSALQVWNRYQAIPQEFAWLLWYQTAWNSDRAGVDDRRARKHLVIVQTSPHSPIYLSYSFLLRPGTCSILLL